MSAIKTLFWKRFSVRTLSVFVALHTWQSADALGESYSSYGARMCADAGIPVDECTLITEPDFVEPEPTPSTGRNVKATTLADHARWLCEKEGVPAEDCLALPKDQRPGADVIPAASPFLTVPATVPVVDVATAPPVAAAPPIPAQRPSVRQILPSPPADRAVRVVHAPPPFDPRLRVAGPPLQPLDPVFLSSGPPFPPIDLGFRRVRQPVRPGPVFREVEFFDAPPPAPEGFGIAEFFGFGESRSDVVAFEERRGFFEESESFFLERRGRCFREVRYSAPPSYRFVTC